MSSSVIFHGILDEVLPAFQKVTKSGKLITIRNAVIKGIGEANRQAICVMLPSQFEDKKLRAMYKKHVTAYINFSIYKKGNRIYNTAQCWFLEMYSRNHILDYVAEDTEDRMPKTKMTINDYPEPVPIITDEDGYV